MKRFLTAVFMSAALIGNAMPANAQGSARQPTQPTSGPGGSNYPHSDVKIIQGGLGNDAWYIFEPATPSVNSAPVAIMTHGYFEFSGYPFLHELIMHTVRKGTIVVYPRYQTGLLNPCPSFTEYMEPCIRSAVNGIKGALQYIAQHPERTQADLSRTSYFGYSFGGIMAANMTSRWQQLGLPRPRAIFLEDPHDGRASQGEPSLDASLSGIPSDVKLQCHSPAQGLVSQEGGERASCNAIWPKLAHIPAANKSLVMLVPDAHGTPALTATHFSCTAPKGEMDAYDFYFCWKVWDALREAPYDSVMNSYAFGTGKNHRFNGNWSDGKIIAPLKVQSESPILP